MPPDYLDTLSAVHRLREAVRRKKTKDAPLWDWTRGYAWKIIKDADDRGRDIRRPAADRKRLAARLRDQCHHQRRAAQYAVQVDGACRSENDRHLCQRLWGRKSRISRVGCGDEQ